MATIQDAIAQNIAKVAELKPLIEAERAQVLAAIDAAASAQQARIDELMAQIAAGVVVTPEQLAALAAPFDELGVAIQNIQQPGAPVAEPAPPAPPAE